MAPYVPTRRSPPSLPHPPTTPPATLVLVAPRRSFAAQRILYTTGKGRMARRRSLVAPSLPRRSRRGSRRLPRRLAPAPPHALLELPATRWHVGCLRALDRRPVCGGGGCRRSSRLPRCLAARPGAPGAVLVVSLQDCSLLHLCVHSDPSRPRCALN